MTDGDRALIEVKQEVAGSQHVFTATGNIYVSNVVPSPVSESDERNLGLLIRKVKDVWIAGVLERSVHTASELELTLTSRFDAVCNPWSTVLEVPGFAREVIPEGKRVSDVFLSSQVSKLMLILGEPGGGKTITMLQLARDLLKGVEAEGIRLSGVPVVFSLSTWRHDSHRLEPWLERELASKYQIPKAISRRWLDENRILPLLDGLDEVREADRERCVEAVNSFVLEHGTPGLVVCCRTQEYMQLPQRLSLNAAVTIEPLTQRQIDQQVAAGGNRLKALRMMLSRNEWCVSLARSPLMLSIMCLAYLDAPVPEESLRHESGDDAITRTKLFELYIDRMFRRRGDRSGKYPTEKTRHYLARIAQGMNQRNQVIFLFEQLQPQLLRRRWEQLCYFLLSRIATALVLFALTLSLAFPAYWARLRWEQEHHTNIGLSKGSLGESSVMLLSINLAAGLVMGLLSWSIAQSHLFRHRPRVRRAFVIGIGILSQGCAMYAVLWKQSPDTRLDGMLMCGVLTALSFALPNGTSVEDDITTAEKMTWSWKGAAVGGTIGLLLALACWQAGLAIAKDQWLFPDLSRGLGIVVGTVIALCAPVLGGLRGRAVSTKAVPNRGIFLTAANGAIHGLSVAGLVLAGLFLLQPVFPEAILSDLDTYELLLGLFLIMAIPCIMMGVGGAYIVRHYALRSMLWMRGDMPLRLRRLFDYAVHLVLMQKVGGGYLFVHRLLLEHIAEEASRPQLRH